MRILGIHDGHNAAACLLVDGKIVAALQEERITRVKNHDCFPARAVEWLLAEAGLHSEQIDAIALNGNHQPRHRNRQMAIEQVRSGASMAPGKLLRRWARSIGPINDAWRKNRRDERLAEARAAGLNPAKIAFIEHHRCHAEAAAWGSPFRNEPFLVLTADGAGDDLCATVNRVDAQGRLARLAQVHESHSPALVYLTATTLLGMVPNEHEYKLMGMAPYAPASGSEDIAAILDDYLEWDPQQPLTWRRRPGAPSAYSCYDWLRARFDMKRFDCICGGLQLWTERLLAEWVRRAVQQTGLRKVALSGGIFMNVKANQVIAALPEVDDLFVFPSCGDETNTMGAAFGCYRDRTERANPPAPPIPSVGPIYWGPSHDDHDIDQALAAVGDEFTQERPADIAAHAAEFLARGEVIARYAGRAEFGARALGNRSIIANPADARVIRTINDMIKSRDFWMPFACSIKAERVADYVVNPKGIRAPYMILTFDTTERRSEIAAGTHPYDFTVRPQVVERDWNPGYWELITAFEKLTGIGGLLNTSFNLHGYPIVNSAAEALDVMRKSGLKYLILGDRWITKRSAEPAGRDEVARAAGAVFGSAAPVLTGAPGA